MPSATARTRKSARYRGEELAAAECTQLVVSLLAEQEGRCASCRHAVHLASHAGIYTASLDRVGGAYDDGTAQVLCLGCQRLYNDLDADERAELTRAIVTASAEPRTPPLAELPEEFARSVEVKVAQMKRREAATDRPSRGGAPCSRYSRASTSSGQGGELSRTHC